MENSTACASCGAMLHGPYCSACGQRASSSHISLRHFAHEAWHELAHLDGKILLTFRTLAFAPGTLTKEFLAGRRHRYLTPLRVYLTCSVLFFGLATLRPDILRSGIRITQTPEDAARSVARGKPQMTDQELADRVNEGFMHWLPRAMFVMMPFFGFLTWLFYRHAERFYVAHLYYSIHFHAFMFAVFALAMLGALAGLHGRPLRLLLVLAIPLYHYTALRRVFGGSRVKVAVRGTAIGILYVITTSAVIIVTTLLILKSEAP